MSQHMKQLIANRDCLTTAINRITNIYQTAGNRLEELEHSLPDLIAAIALEETDASKLEESREEISRLRLITKEPYQKAIKGIDTRRKTISEQIEKAVSEQAAIDRELSYREHFNHCLKTHSRTNADWERLRGDAQHWHRKDIDLLDRIHYEFDNIRHLPDLPAFIDYAASNGLPLYNLDVTIKNITQPKG
jgi:hypothetical protein